MLRHSPHHDVACAGSPHTYTSNSPRRCDMMTARRRDSSRWTSAREMSARPCHILRDRARSRQIGQDRAKWRANVFSRINCSLLVQMSARPRFPPIDSGRRRRHAAKAELRRRVDRGEPRYSPRYSPRCTPRSPPTHAPCVRRHGPSPRRLSSANFSAISRQVLRSTAPLFSAHRGRVPLDAHRVATACGRCVFCPTDEETDEARCCSCRCWRGCH